MVKKFLPFVASLGYLLSAKLAFAAPDPDVGGPINLGATQGNNGIAFETLLGTIVGNAVTIIFSIAALLVLAMLIWGGIEWVLSGGDKEKVGNARKRILSALIGLAVVALAYLIVNIVGGIFGFNVLSNLTLPSLDNPPTQ